MSEFYDLVDEIIGDADALSDISITVRRCYFYDFLDMPIRLWQGKGKLFTTDGNEWLGSIDSAGTDHHNAPAIQDGRDGSSANYTFSMTIPNFPGTDASAIYDELKAQQSSVNNRAITIYLTIFQANEGLRPQTPIVFFKQLIMQSPVFAEAPVLDSNGVFVKKYSVSVTAKDANFGRSRTPNRTYSDANQKEYARQMGVTDVEDRGCEFLALLANRTYTIP